MKPGAVRLNVADLERARAFYEETIGLRVVAEDDGALQLGADGGVVVELVETSDAPRRPPRTTGLFHLAILVPSRLELARALRRIVKSGWSLTGASDHLVSEALYLSDPEGNGIEIYRDRPREDCRMRRASFRCRRCRSTWMASLASLRTWTPRPARWPPKPESATCT